MEDDALDDTGCWDVRTKFLVQQCSELQGAAMIPASQTNGRPISNIAVGRAILSVLNVSLIILVAALK